MSKDQYTSDAYGRTCDKTTDRFDVNKFLRGTRGKAFDKYFDGWETSVVPRKNGRGKKLRRVYTGTLYRQELSKSQRRSRRIVYAVLFLISAALLAAAITMRTVSNYYWFVVVAFIVPLALYCRLLLALNLYIFSGEELTLHEYKFGALALIETSRYIDKAMLVLMIATGAVFVLYEGTYSTSELVRLILLAASVAVAKLIGKLESKVDYTEIPPDEEKSDAGAV